MFSWLTVLLYFVSATVRIESQNLTLKWSYDDETSWPGHHCQYGGLRQSPIDIRLDDVIIDSQQKLISHGDIKTKGYDLVVVNGFNNGHTIQFTCEEDVMARPLLSGGPLEKEYILEQVHFHWLSEHSIEGQKFPVEIHFVHVLSNTLVFEALNMSDGLAIIAVFGNVVQEQTPEEKETTKEIDDQLAALIQPGTRTSGIILNLTKLLGDNLEEYFAYEGSLTSPECNEAVIWIILDHPVVIPESLFDKLNLVSEGRHNYRRTQPTSNIPVYRRYGLWKENRAKVVTVFRGIVNKYKYLFRKLNYLMDRKQWYYTPPSVFKRIWYWNWDKDL